jgi:hypothetical protein
MPQHDQPTRTDLRTFSYRTELTRSKNKLYSIYVPLRGYDSPLYGLDAGAVLASFSQPQRTDDLTATEPK